MPVGERERRTIIIQGLPAGRPHRVLIELADPIHNVIASKMVFNSL
jgi:hypothetical protein